MTNEKSKSWNSRNSKINLTKNPHKDFILMTHSERNI